MALLASRPAEGDVTIVIIVKYSVRAPCSSCLMFLSVNNDMSCLQYLNWFALIVMVTWSDIEIGSSVYYFVLYSSVVDLQKRFILE